jgi:hypothetical protein
LQAVIGPSSSEYKTWKLKVLCHNAACLCQPIAVLTATWGLATASKQDITLRYHVRHVILMLSNVAMGTIIALTFFVGANVVEVKDDADFEQLLKSIKGEPLSECVSKTIILVSIVL